ncbi:MAG: pilus assembly protein PilM [Candidatus Omnitrophota bacterium]
MAAFKDGAKIAFEMREKAIKILRVSLKNGKPEKQEMAVLGLSSEDPQKAGAEIRSFIKKNDIKTKDAVLVIPRQSVTTKVVGLPSEDPRELDDMAAFQAVRQIPYPKEEIISGIIPIETTPEGFTKAMLVICHKDMVERPAAILKESGLILSEVTLSTYGLFNWFANNKDLSASDKAAPVVVVDCDAANTDIAVISNGKLIYTRGLTFGVNDAGLYYDKLLDELQKTLSAFEKEYPGLKPKAAVFTGITSGMRDFGKMFTVATGMTAEFAEVQHEDASFASLAGAVLGRGNVDLMPPGMKRDRSSHARKKEKLFSGVLMLAVAALLFLLLLNRIRFEEKSLSEIEEELKTITPSVQALESMKTATDIVESQADKSSEALESLNEFYRITPSSIKLSLYKYDGSKVEVKGSAETLSEVFRFVKIVENSKYFRNAEVKYAAKKRTGEREFVDFEIFCSISKDRETVK